MPPTTQLIRYSCLVFVLLLFTLHFLFSSTSTTYSSHVSSAKDKLGFLSLSTGRGTKEDVWYGGRRVSGKLDPKLDPIKGRRDKVNATFVSLARNRDLWELLTSIRGIEDRFNTRLGFNYDWIFLNDEPFSEEFKKHTKDLVSGDAKYGLIRKEEWGDGFPQGINATLAQEKIDAMGKLPIPYAGSVPYRKMCRYNSGFFYEHELLSTYDYYWRVEPNVKFFCNLDYDPFRLMKEQNKKYGFVVSLYEYRETVETLWKTTKEWMEKFPQYLAKPNMLNWISPDGGNSYNLCHYWSNFEIGALDFYRSDAYRSYFKYLDDSGGFFYERWGDAPVHSIAAALLLKPEEMHYFSDIGYRHEPFQHCPVASISNACACSTKTEENFEFHGYSCTPRWKEVTGYKTPSPFNWGE